MIVLFTILLHLSIFTKGTLTGKVGGGTSGERLTKWEIWAGFIEIFLDIYLLKSTDNINKRKADQNPIGVGCKLKRLHLEF